MCLIRVYMVTPNNQHSEMFDKHIMKTLSKIIVGICLFTTEAIYSCPLNNCQTIERPSQDAIFFTQNGRQVSSASRVLFVTSPNTSCLVNTYSVLDIFHKLPTDTDFVGNLVFFCPKPLEIEFSPYNGSSFANIIGYLQIVNCIINMENINEISRTVDMRVVTLHKAHVNNRTSYCKNDTDMEPRIQCEGLSTTVAFTIYPLSGYPKPNIYDILACQDTFPSMTEVSFVNMSWNVIPDFLKIKFPNLQTLDIKNNNLTVPPDFPWIDTDIELPRNLSRSAIFQSHYSNVFHVEIKPNIYRRLLKLDNNRISDLSNYQFHGYLHMLTINSNNLQNIGSLTFHHIRGLQHLSLSDNSLTSLPVDTFKNLSELQHLDMSKNKLIHLIPGIFDKLRNLKYLNLANNSLISLDPGLFSQLSYLEELRMELNNLISIPTDVMPVSSVRLKNVFFNNNPITDFPESLFYLRNLKLADLRNTSIIWNISNMIHNTNSDLLGHSVIESASDSTIDLTKTPGRLRVIDLSGSNIRSFRINETWEKENQIKLLLILKNFKFILDKNPLSCDCTMNNFKKLVSSFQLKNFLSGKEYFFEDWKCVTPIEFLSQSMFSVTENDTYCKVDILHCPPGCICSKRYKQEITIIDCRQRQLTKLPRRLPSGILDLWFEDNNITMLTVRPYLIRVRQLYLSRNSLSVVNSKAISKMKNLKEIFLNSNLLQKIPAEIQLHQLTKVLLRDNPLECDCHAIWMKNWLLENRDIVKDSNDISCSSETDEGRKLIVTPDNQFVCKEEFDQIKHVIIPTVCSSLALAVLIVATGLLIAYRLEVKVLLYIYFGIHPFDKDEGNCTEEYDVAIVHAPSITSWVMDHIVTTLEKEGHSYIVCEMMRDFVAGFSYHENISSVVRRSKRMLLIVSPSLSLDNDLFKLSWNEAQHKIKQIRTNYAILICHEVSPDLVQNKDLKILAKRNRLINTTEKLFKEKLLYLMPITKTDTNQSVVVYNSGEDHNISALSLDTVSVHTMEQEISILITYAEEDIHYVIKSLVPELERFGYNVCLPDRDFILGASKEENILNAIHSCRHTLFILSGEQLQDEWLLFTFRCASEKSLREKSNHLIVILLDNVNIQSMDEEINYYVRTHVTLKTSNPWFWRRVRDALSRCTLDNQLFTSTSNGGTAVIEQSLPDLHSIEPPGDIEQPPPEVSNTESSNNVSCFNNVQSASSCEPEPSANVKLTSLNSEKDTVNDLNRLESLNNTAESFVAPNLRTQDETTFNVEPVKTEMLDNALHNLICDTCNTCVVNNKLDDSVINNGVELNNITSGTCNTCVMNGNVYVRNITPDTCNTCIVKENDDNDDVLNIKVDTCNTCVMNENADVSNITPGACNTCVMNENADVSNITPWACNTCVMKENDDVSNITPGACNTCIMNENADVSNITPETCNTFVINENADVSNIAPVTCNTCVINENDGINNISPNTCNTCTMNEGIEVSKM